MIDERLSVTYGNGFRNMLVANMPLFSTLIEYA